MIEYHDCEWCVPCYDDQRLFELLTLEGAQAGLSWSTILKKREGYRKAFAGFNIERVARYTGAKQAKLLQNPEIVRNRLKVESTVENAKAILRLRGQEGSLSQFLWDFVGGVPIQNRWRSKERIPAATPLSRRMSRELKKRGFRFVGPTVCYAFMQAAGMVNDHLVRCFRHQTLRDSS